MVVFIDGPPRQVTIGIMDGLLMKGGGSAGEGKGRGERGHRKRNCLANLRELGSIRASQSSYLSNQQQLCKPSCLFSTNTACQLFISRQILDSHRWLRLETYRACREPLLTNPIMQNRISQRPSLPVCSISTIEA